MTTYAFLLDLARCVGCKACSVACKVGNEVPKTVAFTTVDYVESGTFPNLQNHFVHHRCYHCAQAACVEACPTSALYKEDGLTRLDREKCSGCSYCVDACPYDVPVLAGGRASKCDACNAVVKAGGQPWCVKTCPTDALRYDERDAILAEAKARLSQVQAHYPNARIYGETELDGLGVIMILPDAPEALGLPADPKVPIAMDVWQKAVQPASIGLTGLSLAFTGLAAIIARRNHQKEMGHTKSAVTEKEA